MIALTDSAIAQVKVAMQAPGMENLALRFAGNVKSDGSIDYLMGFDETKDHDIEIDISGVKIVIQPEYEDILDGMTMDFVELEDGKGEKQFVFMNPNDPNYVPPKTH